MQRWFLDSTRLKQLAVDNEIGKSTAYTYLDEGFTVLATQATALESALPAAKMAGHSHISIDGTLIETDRCRTRPLSQLCATSQPLPVKIGTIVAAAFVILHSEHNRTT